MINFHRILDFKPRYMRQHISELVHMLETIYEDAPIRNMIEIGVYEGGSTYVWGQLVRRTSQDRNASGFVYAIDEKIGDEGSTLPGWERQAPVYWGTLVEANIVEIVGHSEDPEIIRRLKERIEKDGKRDEIDLLYIDGDHSYEAARSDFENYCHFVRPYGWIGFHDIKKPSMGVVQYWNEISGKYEHHEFIMQRQHPDAQCSIYEGYDVIGTGLLRWPG
jgi:cephalosporin hydroxylase